jgi:hypothetical protein
LGFNIVSLCSCICGIKFVRYQEPLYQFEFILPPLGLEITITIVNKTNINLLLTYCYNNILIINCFVIPRECTITMVMIWLLFLKESIKQ